LCLTCPRGFLLFMKSGNSSHCHKDSSAGFCSKPNEIGSHSITLKHILILSSAVYLASEIVSLPQIVLLQFCVHFSSPSCVLKLPIFGDDYRLRKSPLGLSTFCHSSAGYHIVPNTNLGRHTKVFFSMAGQPYMALGLLVPSRFHDHTHFETHHSR
jgi:hypothetical protein